MVAAATAKKKKKKQQKRKTPETTDDRKQIETEKKTHTRQRDIEKNRERTSPQRLAVRDD